MDAKTTKTGIAVIETKIDEGCYSYSAWEPATLFSHSTIRHDPNGACWGQLGTRQIPAEVEAMKGGSDERAEACRAWRKAQHELADAAIVEAFPELTGCHVNVLGQMSIYGYKAVR
jgi:hypothetical protein